MVFFGFVEKKFGMQNSVPDVFLKAAWQQRCVHSALRP